MLQQTRVAVVIGYYERFLRRFPTVQSLAKAKEVEVLALWSGLGYYRRARMMHRAAKEIVARNGFPRTAEALRELPGIGRYTAAAIASICFGERSAVVDGNVERVLQRLYGKQLSPNEQWRLADELISAQRPGDSNQAWMELGAMVCTPANPECAACPLLRHCRHEGTLARPGQTRAKAEVHLTLDVQQDRVRLVQRDRASSLMAGMWELPAHAGTKSDAPLRFRHSITNTDYLVYVHQRPTRQGRFVHRRQYERLPLTGLTRKVLRAAALLK